MKVTILCVGKIKEKFYVDAIGEYSKRLSRYCTLEIKEVSDEKTPDGASDVVVEQIKDKEGQKMLKVLNESSYVIALCIDGKQLDSVQLSEKMQEIGVNGQSHITFLIGGSLGLSKELISQADFKLSFSKMTFPHQLMRVILLEQVYRSYRIANNEPYHK